MRGRVKAIATIAAVAVIVIGSAVFGIRSGDDGDRVVAGSAHDSPALTVPPSVTTTTAVAEPETPTSTVAPPATAAPPVTAAPPATTATSASPSVTSAPSATTLSPGDRGPAVAALQQRLLALGFWLGRADGVYGDATRHALVALQKANGLKPSGVADSATLAAAAAAVRPPARTPSGRAVEIDRSRQLLFLVQDGRVDWVFDTSTGRPGFTTPLGHFTVYRQVDAPNVGGDYRPKYYTGDLAIHGYGVVPPYPFSHGCARVTTTAMDWIWSSGRVPVGTPVWIY